MAAQIGDQIAAQRGPIVGRITVQEIIDLVASAVLTSQTFFAEESTAVSTGTNGGFQWSAGNGDETPQTHGLVALISGTITTLGLEIEGAGSSSTVEVYINGVATGVTISATGNVASVLDVAIVVTKGDIINFRTTASAGTSVSGRISAVCVGTAPATGTPVNSSAATDGQEAYWDATAGEVRFRDATGGGGTDAAAVTAIAAGSTQGLEQQLLAADGQVGKTVLAVPYTYYQGNTAPTTNHKVQLTSLGAGNVMFVYATGADFNNGVVQEGPVFLRDGEIYVIENVQNGSIITLTEGGYGYCQARSGNNESPMPLLSLALGITDTFCFAFRNSNSNEGRIYAVNGPIASTVELRNAAGNVVLGQTGIELDPWEFVELSTDGNGEYRLISTNLLMPAIAANQDVPQFYDLRLVLPTANKIATWPRSGFMSAPFAGTAVEYFVNDGATGTFTVNPGSPVDIDAGAATGASDQDYEPRGATIFEIAGLASAFSGADSSGLEASPACPTKFFTQKLALPLHIRNAGDGGNNGIALLSEYVGTARIYEWNQTTNQLDLVTVNDPSGTPTTEILLQRRNGDVELGDAVDRQAQRFPASALISAQGAGGTDPNAYDLLGDFNGGLIIVDVPAMCVFNSEQNENGQTDHTFRGTSGATVAGIHADDDEQLTFGIIPESIRAEIREGVDGRLYKRQIATGGVDTWVVA